MRAGTAPAWIGGFGNLEIARHDALLVRRLQGVGDLRRDGDGAGLAFEAVCELPDADPDGDIAVKPGGEKMFRKNAAQAEDFAHLLHTQEVRGSSPCAPTILVNQLREISLAPAKPVWMIL